MVDASEAPTTFHYEHWRHGGWYTNVYYPSGACGCVSRNYDDGKWRIACDPRPFEQRPTFKNRDAAALAEWHLAEAEWTLVRAAAGDLFDALDRAVDHKAITDPFCLKLAKEALAKAKGQAAAR
ncbi:MULTISPECIES: hypothetical protein [Mesorhizobium]|uniref:hypothetical protein n=1 Tax=Mesorhizobium TaxID=68287 RepID=UPI000AED4CF5|nr:MULTISPECIES: hypothetical protein [Mesorhizobium]MDF3208379.1 hypothetical protein [Mesorhizobium sp. LMG15046]MDF3229050.1 hypothetical protein [Mesorhizobium sp. DSM 30133]RUU22164.1 hypothetical protein EOC84_03370 [Mesorhizobium sp. Primo-B]RUU37926.1 hypothetical protein EOC83_16845 [Mesorhizobium sp. Primo-A]RVB61853.1 hypothetical protein EN895_21980 [Mesorhizobium sp. M7A.F.Ca.CA.002.03.2.1]